MMIDCARRFRQPEDLHARNQEKNCIYEYRGQKADNQRRKEIDEKVPKVCVQYDYERQHQDDCRPKSIHTIVLEAFILVDWHLWVSVGKKTCKIVN